MVTSRWARCADHVVIGGLPLDPLEDASEHSGERRQATVLEVLEPMAMNGWENPYLIGEARREGAEGHEVRLLRHETGPLRDLLVQDVAVQTPLFQIVMLLAPPQFGLEAARNHGSGH